MAKQTRAEAAQRFKEGRTGGQPIQKPQTGPMVGRPDGDVPYNYYGGPNESGPKLSLEMTKQRDEIRRLFDLDGKTDKEADEYFYRLVGGGVK